MDGLHEVGDHIVMRLPHFAAATVAIAAVSTAANAIDINTGDKTGAYHSHFCPAIEKRLRDAKFNYRCRTSPGSAENIKRIQRDPRQIGYAQADVFALLTPGMGGAKTFATIRNDDVRECVFAVTRDPQITNYGALAVNAAKIKFVLPPLGSGSDNTFRYLQKIDPKGLGSAKQIRNAKTTDEAITAALSDDQSIAIFVQFPDPSNVRFKLINKLKGRIIPVIDRVILRQDIAGKKVYFAEETEITTGSWIKTKTRIVTACTPLVLFTGAPARITDPTIRKDHIDLIRTLKALKREQVMLENNFFSRMWKRTRELSATSAKKLLEISDQARKNAKPYVDKAREATKQAGEAAKPYLDQAKRKVNELIDKAKPRPQPQPQPRPQ